MSVPGFGFQISDVAIDKGHEQSDPRAEEGRCNIRVPESL